MGVLHTASCPPLMTLGLFRLKALPPRPAIIRVQPSGVRCWVVICPQLPAPQASGHRCGRVDSEETNEASPVSIVSPTLAAAACTV